MHTSSAQHIPAETETISLHINLLALNLAIELVRAGEAERRFSLPAAAVQELCERLEDDEHQIGAGDGLQRAIEELEHALRQAEEATRRSPGAPGQMRSEAETSDQMRAEAINRR